jgi:hypothetical protein
MLALIAALMRWLLLCLWMVSCVEAAQLQFSTVTLELRPTAGDSVITAHYTFHNSGTEPLTITKVDPSCGCTTTTLARTTYQADERGELLVAFDTTGLGGVQEKTIQVYYDKGAMILLHLRAILAEAPSVSPTFLYWQVGADPAEQVAKFSFPPEVNEYPTEVVASSSAITGTLHHHDDGSWVIAVTPTSTAEMTNVMLKINTNLGRTMRIFGSVRK